MKFKGIFMALFALSMAVGMQAQKINFLHPVPHRSALPNNAPTFAKPHLEVNQLTGTVSVYSRNDREWSTLQKTGADYGEMYIADTCAMSFAATTALPIERLTAGTLSGFTMVSDSVLRYDGTEAKVFQALFNGSISFSEANNILSGYFIIGTTAQTKSRFKTTAVTLNARYNVTGSALLTLSPGDTVRFMLVPSTHTGTDVITVRDGNIALVEVR